MHKELHNTKKMLTLALISLLASILLNIFMANKISTIINDQAVMLEDQRDAGYADGFDDGFKEGNEAQAEKWVDAIVEWCYLEELEGPVCESYQVGA